MDFVYANFLEEKMKGKGHVGAIWKKMTIFKIGIEFGLSNFVGYLFNLI